mgnify:CR=1 FL=1
MVSNLLKNFFRVFDVVLDFSYFVAWVSATRLASGHPKVKAQTAMLPQHKQCASVRKFKMCSGPEACVAVRSPICEGPLLCERPLEHPGGT